MSIFRIIARLIIPAILLGAGWIAGAKLGAPAVILDAVDRYAGIGADKAQDAAGALADAAGDELQDVTDDVLAHFDDDQEVIDDAGHTADEIVPRDDAEDAQADVQDETPTAPAPKGALNSRLTDGPDQMRVCLATISNAPPFNDRLVIKDYKKFIDVAGVTMLLAPVTKSCVSSGFGARGSRGRFHKGVDYYSNSGGDVLAAADGVIREALYRDDYGYMIVIDHGNDVFTRYAHLKRFEGDVDVGKSVTRGQVLGPIGMSGAYTSVIHLHWEILRGDYNTRRKSFGLTPADPFSFPKSD